MSNNEQPTDADKLNELITEKKIDGKKIAIFSHRVLDPDAIGSMLGIEFLINKIHGIDCDLIYDGEISHPLNKAVVQILDVQLQKIDDYKSEDYFLNILVDTVPANAGVGNRKDIKFQVCADHHKQIPNGDFSGLVIHEFCGAASSIVYSLIKDNKIELEDGNEKHAKIATALLVGIITDTSSCLSADTTTLDFTAMQNLFDYRDADGLRKITHFSRPLSWMRLKQKAYNDVVINDGVAITGLGLLDDANRDVLPDLADDILLWGGNVQIVVVFALFYNRLEGCIRANNEAVEVNQFCKLLGVGNGGGRACKGAYKKFLGDFCIEDTEDEDLQEEMWNAIKKREIANILKVLKK